jgi:putative ABC transport system permease protein
MHMLREGWQRLRSLLHRREFDERLEDEIRFHVEQQAEQHRRDGMPDDEARRRARLQFGAIQAVREQARDQMRAAPLEHVVRDVRYGWRSLRRAPVFTTVVVGILALGIGATTTMFSVVYGVLLRPLPYPGQERLVAIAHDVPALGRNQFLGSPAIYFGYRDYNRTFAAIGHWDWDDSPVTVSGQGEPESVASLEVTHEVLPMLGAHPAAGRSFSASDDQPGAPLTVIVSHAFAARRFGRQAAVGRTLVVDGVAREVVGVLPEGFRFFEYDAHIYYPLQHVRGAAQFPSGDGRAIALLKDGVTLAEANADVARMIPLLRQEFGREEQAVQLEIRPALRPLKDSVVGDLSETLWILMGTIALLWLIACANAANLLLVRTQARVPELVVRSALGAGRAAIARVVLAEAMLLGGLGGAAGVAVAYAGLPVLVALGGDALPQVMSVRIDLIVLLVSAATALLAIAVAVSVPLLQLALGRVQHAETLRGARAASDGGAGLRAREVLVVVQVATALVLLNGSGLMMRTYSELRRVEPGFRAPEAVQTFQLTVPVSGPLEGEEGEPHRARLLATLRDILDRLSAVGGVDSVGFASGNDGLPLDGDGRQLSMVPYVDGVRATDGVPRLWEVQNVSPGLLETMQTRIVAGRGITWDDIETQREVMLVSESLARREWGSMEAALGRRVSASPDDPASEIIGVIEDVHHDGLTQPAPHTVVFPPRARDTATFAVRSHRAGQADFQRDLRAAIWSVNPHLAMARPQTLGAMYRRAMSRTSMTLWLLGMTGGLALLLGMVGVYGVVSYTVTRRRREIGIRLALGARRADVSGMFVRHALVVVGVGVLIGLAASAGLTRLIASQLFGINPMDVPTRVAVGLGLLAAASLASGLSAWRGAALEPSEVLRAE